MSIPITRLPSIPVVENWGLFVYSFMREALCESTKPASFSLRLKSVHGRVNAMIEGSCVGIAKDFDEVLKLIQPLSE